MKNRQVRREIRRILKPGKATESDIFVRVMAQCGPTFAAFHEMQRAEAVSNALGDKLPGGGKRELTKKFFFLL